MLLRHAVRGALCALVLASTLASVAAGATVSLAEVGLPASKTAARELKYALGKNWEAALRGEIEQDLAAAKVFDAIVAEGGDVSFGLALDELVRTFDDRVALSGRGSLGFRAAGRWRWSRGGTIVKEGPFETRHVVKIDREPWRSDLAAGWREVIRLAVSEAVSGGHDEVLAAPP